MARTPSSPQHAAALGPRRRWLIAGASLAAAAIIVVAVVVPVTALTKAQPATYKAATTQQPVNSQTSSNSVSSSSGPNPGSSSTKAPAATATTAPTPGSSSSSNTKALTLPGPRCNGIPGLCSVPVRYATFLGTHNSNAIKVSMPIFENQDQGFKQQLQDGVRLFDLDYSGQSGGRFAHCLNCLCGYSTSTDDAAAAKVFNTMGSFLDANPSEVILLGMSNINCGDVSKARVELLGALADSTLAKHVAVRVLDDKVTLGELVKAGQRAVLVFYDQWGKSTGYDVGNKYVPPQPLVRYYGGNTVVDATGPAATDLQSATQLSRDILAQYSNSTAATNPLRVLGMFASSCFACRTTALCGTLSCAMGINRESFTTYLLGAATAAWRLSQASSSKELIPAFNGFQVDYYQLPSGAPGVLALVDRVNGAFAWLYANQPSALAAGLGLANCAWVLEDAVYSGLLLCAHHGKQGLVAADAGRGFRVLLPANKDLKVNVLKGGKVVQALKGDGGKISQVGLSGPFDSLEVVWVTAKKVKF